MLRSRSNTLVSVRRVTERNAGRLIAGVDGGVVLTPKAKSELAGQGDYRRAPVCSRLSSGAARPVR
jgi:RNA-directed DNA polymerase